MWCLLCAITLVVVEGGLHSAVGDDGSSIQDDDNDTGLKLPW